MRTKMIVVLLASLAFARAGELHQAARECDADRMREILSQGPAVNATDESGRTPLHVAIDARHAACVDLLLAAGADHMARDGKGRTAFRATDEITDQREQTAIRLSLVGNLAKDASEEVTGPKPWSLEYSVMRGQTGATKMLLQLGADPNAMGTRGTTPLGDASLKGYLEGVRLLLDAGARIDAVSQAGNQPIHDAALGGSAEVIRELGKRGADVNARTRDQARSPLHLAAAMGRMEAVEALVSLGADVAVEDSEGRTALEVAERAGRGEVVAVLRRAAAGQ